MLKLTLVTPEKKLLTGETVKEIFVPAHKGELNILQGHAPLLTTLTTGVLRFTPANSETEKVAAISWGFLEVNDDHVTVLAETAEAPDEIDSERAKAALEKASKIVSGESIDTVQLLEHETRSVLEKYSQKMERAVVRLSIIKK